jgi:hypothetical protein
MMLWRSPIDAIKTRCKDSLGALNLQEQDRLMAQAIQMFGSNQVAEANALIRRLNALKQLSENLAAMVCRPD